MSKEARTWAWAVADLTMAERVILLYLGERANKEGLAWPKSEKIEEHTTASRGTVWRAMKTFHERRLVSELGPGVVPGGANVEHRYQLHITPTVLQIATDEDEPRRETRHP